MFLIIYLHLFYYKYISIFDNKKKKVDIDNIYIDNIYEKDINFSNYSSKIKSIAIYYPQYIYINNYLKEKFNNLSLTEVILKQTNLAKRHGIYGFAIFYYYNNNKYNEIYDIFLYNINFNFLFIWENNNNNVLEKFDYLNIFIINIKKYLLSKYYIKINGKQVLSINKPTSFSNLNELLLILREKFKNNGIEIYILCPLTHIYIEKIYINIFDGYFDLLNFDLYNYVYSGHRIIYYQGLIYKNLYINKKSYSSTIYRSSIIEIDNKSKKNLLKYYTPEKFYHLNRIIINWTIKHYKETNGIIFINSWNNYKEGNYLEPDERYGSANINCFSKALFNIPFKCIN